MNLELSKIITAINDKIKTERLGDVILWADTERDNAWSNAILRFESALVYAMENNDHTIIREEAEIYKTTCLCLIEDFKMKDLELSL